MLFGEYGFSRIIKSKSQFLFFEKQEKKSFVLKPFSPPPPPPPPNPPEEAPQPQSNAPISSYVYLNTTVYERPLCLIMSSSSCNHSWKFYALLVPTCELPFGLHTAFLLLIGPNYIANKQQCFHLLASSFGSDQTGIELVCQFVDAKPNWINYDS